MPKSGHQRPLSCLFGINKPTGQPSMTLLNKLQPLFSQSSLFQDPTTSNEGQRQGRRWKQNRIKMGQGGTLDPLADGVLVVGTNQATKRLSQFLDSTKTYTCVGMLGCSTDSYDSEGKVVKEAKWDEVTREKVEGCLEQFRGEIQQTPPVYSALKMDGKPLYEYARSNTPLPRPIPSRTVTISHLRLLSFTRGEDHEYEAPKERLGEEERKEVERLEKMVKEGGTVVPTEEEIVDEKPSRESVDETTKEASTTPTGSTTTTEIPPTPTSATTTTESSPSSPSKPLGKPPIFEITVTVSSGTYIRSIVHDLGIALGSLAHVVKLTRTRQGKFSLNPDSYDSRVEEEEGEGKEGEGKEGDKELSLGCIEWNVFEKALKKLGPPPPKKQQQQNGKGGGKKGKGKGQYVNPKEQEEEEKVVVEMKVDADGEDQVGGEVKEEEEERDGDGYVEWEREILRLCQVV